MIAEALAGHPSLSARHLCALLDVNRAWYYERQKLRAEREKEESELKAAVEKLLLEFNGYGYRRVTKALQRQGWCINHKKVLRLLRKWGLLCRPLRKKKLATTQSDPKAPYAENLLKKYQAELGGVNRAWVGEVSMIPRNAILAPLAANRRAVSNATSPPREKPRTRIGCPSPEVARICAPSEKP